MLAAVRMAAEDINAGKYLKLTSDSILPRTKLLMSVDNSPPTYTSTVLAVVQEVDNAFNGTGINVVIGDVDNIVTQSLASIFQEFDIAQIGYNQGSLSLVYACCR